MKIFWTRVIEKRFKNNLPSDDWVKGFTKRNNLSKTAASNIKRSQAAVDEKLANSFFDNLEKVFEEIGELLKFLIFTYCIESYKNYLQKKITKNRRCVYKSSFIVGA